MSFSRYYLGGQLDGIAAKLRMQGSFRGFGALTKAAKKRGYQLFLKPAVTLCWWSCAVSPIEPDTVTPTKTFARRRPCAAICRRPRQRLAGAKTRAGVGQLDLRRLFGLVTGLGRVEKPGTGTTPPCWGDVGALDSVKEVWSPAVPGLLMEVPSLLWSAFDRRAPRPRSLSQTDPAPGAVIAARRCRPICGRLPPLAVFSRVIPTWWWARADRHVGATRASQNGDTRLLHDTAAARCPGYGSTSSCRRRRTARGAVLAAGAVFQRGGSIIELSSRAC